MSCRCAPARRRAVTRPTDAPARAVAAHDLDAHPVAVQRAALHAGRDEDVAPLTGARSERLDEAEPGPHPRVAPLDRDLPGAARRAPAARRALLTPRTLALRGHRRCTGDRLAPRHRTQVDRPQPLVARLADAPQLAPRDLDIEQAREPAMVVALELETARELGNAQRPRRDALEQRQQPVTQRSRVVVVRHHRCLSHPTPTEKRGANLDRAFAQL